MPRDFHKRQKAKTNLYVFLCFCLDFVVVVDVVFVSRSH